MAGGSISARFRRLTVADAQGLLHIDATIVREHTTLREVAKQAIGMPQSRVIAVVNQQDRVVGILPMRTLSFRVLEKILPERALILARDSDDMPEFLAATHGETAGECMIAPHVVTLEMSLGKAFETIMRFHLDGLPVVDGVGRVVGYLDVMEILKYWVEHGEEGA